MIGDNEKRPPPPEKGTETSSPSSPGPAPETLNIARWTDVSLKLTFEHEDQTWAIDGLIDAFSMEGEIEKLPPDHDGWERRRPTGRSTLNIRLRETS